ncbi:hypothetical protein VJ918_02075 [Adlercreutzia sp. R21]|uniref:cyanophycin synthetase family protein n=1 Tax=Adlercreutzia wanghongyangiae TaxID=3111451 RepID=UPI002DBAEC06|nr:hypothetical protein [Adlercreutzia sp. R21]MEC4183587.1 hypothetical protein [Adlercreutzia sp. R21]
MSLLAVERIAFERDRMVLLVRVPGGAQAHLGPDAAARLREARPFLAGHACLNAEGAPFGAVLERTSLPHVLEHLVIDFQAEATADHRSATTFVGTTEWLNEREGLARVAVNFTDDLIALAALKAACALMEGMVD